MEKKAEARLECGGDSLWLRKQSLESEKAITSERERQSASKTVASESLSNRWVFYLFPGNVTREIYGCLTLGALLSFE